MLIEAPRANFRIRIGFELNFIPAFGVEPIADPRQQLFADPFAFVVGKHCHHLDFYVRQIAHGKANKIIAVLTQPTSDVSAHYFGEISGCNSINFLQFRKSYGIFPGGWTDVEYSVEVIRCHLPETELHALLNIDRKTGDGLITV